MPSADFRVLEFVNLHTSSYVGNIAYSIFRTDVVLESLLEKIKIRTNGVWTDRLFGALLVGATTGLAIPGYPFKKCYNGKWPGSSGWLILT